MKTLKAKRYASVWDALEDTPDAAENMRMRSELIRSLVAFIEESGMSQQQAAQRLAVTQPRISDLMRGKIGLFSLDALLNMAVSAGFRVHMQLQPPERFVPSHSAEEATLSSPASAA